MSIDEAIAQEKFKARVDRIKANKRIFHNNDEDEISACHRSAEEHEQIAEWLEELKEYKKNSNTCPMCDTYCSYLAEEFENGFNKAIDDFADKLKQDVMTITFGLRICDIDRIAEQLKERESD